MEEEEVGKMEERKMKQQLHRRLSPLCISSSSITSTSSSSSSPGSIAASSPLSSPSSSSSSCSSTPSHRHHLPHDPLLPGLPDDLALACLLRLPLPSQAVGKSVCRRWHSALSSPEYLHTRRSLGRSEPWLLVLAFHKVTGRIQWQALEPSRRAWHIVPAMPCRERVCPPGFGCVANAEEGALFVCGGMRSDIDCPMDSVLKYELSMNRWTEMGPMSTPRSFFASGMIDGRIYAAGGNSTESFELSSAEVYDPAEDKWHPVANMRTNISRYDAAVLNGKLYVTEGWSWPFLFSPRGQIYDPKQDRWETMTLGMREGWTGLSVVLDDHLFIISEHDSSKLKVYDSETDSWKCVGGSPMPSHVVLPFTVSTSNGKLLVVARSLHVAIGTIFHSFDEEGRRAVSVEWQAIHAPESFSDFVPSHSLVLYA